MAVVVVDVAVVVVGSGPETRPLSRIVAVVVVGIAGSGPETRPFSRITMCLEPEMLYNMCLEPEM